MNLLKKRLIKVILLLISCMFLLNTGIKVYADTNEYDMKITSGIDGKFRVSKYIPITVEFKSLEKDFSGEVEIRVDTNDINQYDAYSKEVIVSKGESTKVTIPIKILDGMSKISINLIENDKILYTKKSLVSNGRISDSNILMGILTDDLTSLSYIDKVLYSENNFSSVIEKVEINSEIIGENNLNIDTLDVILINNFNLAKFNDSEYNSLNTWINNGGTLIIGSGENSSKTIGNIKKDFLNIEAVSNTEANVLIDKENINLVLSKLNLENENIEMKSGDNPLLYSIERGKGEILISTFDLGLEPFISSDSSKYFIKEALKNVYFDIYNKNMNGGYYGYYGYYGLDITKNLPINEIVSENILMIILLVYALIVGVVVYIVLKKMNKRDLNWVVVPGVAIVFTIIIYFMGYPSRLNDVILNQNNIISINENGQSEVKGYIGIGSKYRDNLIIKKPETVDMNYSVEDYYYYGNSTEENTNKTLRVKTTYSGDDSYFTFENASALDMKPFKISGKEEVLTKIDSSFNIVNGKLQGTVKNNFEYDIENLILLSGNSLFELGPLSKGEEKALKDISISSSSGLQSYAETMNQKYYENKWKKEFDEKDPKFKNILRKASLLSMISNEFIMSNSTKLIAITNIPIDYEIDFDNKSISKFDTTVVIQDAEVDFKDENGVYSFPDGYFKPIATSIDTNVHLDEYNGYIYGQGEIVFDYEIDKNIKIEEVTVKAGVDRYGYSGYLTDETYVYNFNTGSYDKITMAQGYEKLKNIDSYIQDNIIKIKCIVDDSTKGQSVMPNINVKGRDR